MPDKPSEGKIKTLLALLSGQKDATGLSEAIGSDKSTALHFAAALRKEGLVAKDEKMHCLTSIGRLHAMLLRSMVTGKAAIEENKAFWEGHDVSSIPDDLMAQIGLLAGCQCVQDNGHTVMKSLDNFLRLMGQAKAFYGASSVIAPGHVDLISGLITRGANVELILGESIIGLISCDMMASWQAHSNFTLYSMPDTCRAAFAVSEEVLSLGLYLPDGHYDTNQDLICRGPGAVKWGRKLFEHYRGLAKVVR